MPGLRNPPAKWVLPAVVDPPDSICITIPVPNDRQHIGAFWGALYNLTSARFWADDTAHTALAVARVWQNIYDALKPDSCDVPPIISIEEWEDTLSICESLRFENGKLQGLCCGEWVDISGQGDSTLGGPGQPGGGADQPVQGGPPTCYHANSPASLQWLAPTTVSAGDVLTFSNFDGAAWDGVAPFPLPGRWDCPNGQFFFGGECQAGSESLDGSDPLPTAPHMSLVTQIDGTWYSCLSPVTVPGGVSNAQILVQLNDSGIGDNQGQYAFDCCVENNQVSASFHLFNFTEGPKGWTNYTDSDVTVDKGVWSAGDGWMSTTGLTSAGVHRTAIYIQAPAVGAVIVDKVTVKYSFTAGTPSANPNDRLVEIQSASSGLVANTDLANTADGTQIMTGPFTLNPAVIWFACAKQDAVDPSPTGQIIMTSIRFDFPGADPYAAF